jgi:hypothetical protein
MQGDGAIRRVPELQQEDPVDSSDETETARYRIIKLIHEVIVVVGHRLFIDSDQDSTGLAEF